MRSARGRGQLPRQTHTEARSDHLLHPSNQLVQPSGQGFGFGASSFWQVLWLLKPIPLDDTHLLPAGQSFLRLMNGFEPSSVNW